MKKQFLIVAMIGFAPFILAGCDRSQPETPRLPSPGSSAHQASSPVDTTTATSSMRATLTVIPGSVSTCVKGTHINPEVTWQRIDPAVKNTRVTVSSPGSSNEKLFATGGFGGSVKAGDWVVPGVTFHLYDADTGAALSSYTVAALPCTH